MDRAGLLCRVWLPGIYAQDTYLLHAPAPTHDFLPDCWLPGLKILNPFDNSFNFRHIHSLMNTVTTLE